MTNEYIEMDNLFMFSVDLRRDKCMWNEELYRFPFDEKIHNNFQNILDLVKPLKKIRPCSDDEIEKYKFYFDKDIENTLDYEKCYTVLLEQVKDKTTDEKIAFLAPLLSASNPSAPEPANKSKITASSNSKFIILNKGSFTLSNVGLVLSPSNVNSFVPLAVPLIILITSV